VYGTTAVFGMADMGTLPGLGTGAGISAGIAWRRLRVEILGVSEPFHSTGVAEVPNAGVRARALRAGGHACVPFLDAPIEVGPCAGLGLVAITAQAFGVTHPGEANRMWGEVTLGGGLRWRFMPHIGLALDGDAQIALYRHHLAIPPLGDVFVVPSLTGRVTMGLFALWPLHVRGCMQDPLG
jgi:hypothetical protein